MEPTDLDPFTAHGGRIEAARAMFGGEDWIDLSTGIAPWSYEVGEHPPLQGEEDQPQAGGGVDHVSPITFASGVGTPLHHRLRRRSPSPCRGGCLGFDHLPEPDALRALEQTARAAFGVPAEREVVAVPGTDLALRLLPALIPAQRVAVVGPGYSGHVAAWPGAQVVSAMEPTDADLVVLANPNNPDGRLFDRAALLGLAHRATLIVDEAFADADPRESVADVDDERLIVLRSFGKFYGLPGLRLGFVIAPRAIAAGLRAMLGDWPISSAAIAIGTAAYADTRWQDEQRGRIAEARDRLDAARSGFPIVGGTSLFRLIEAPGARLFRHLASRAILARPFADRQERLRLGLPRDAAAADRLAKALKEFTA